MTGCRRTGGMPFCRGGVALGATPSGLFHGENGCGVGAGSGRACGPAAAPGGSPAGELGALEVLRRERDGQVLAMLAVPALDLLVAGDGVRETTRPAMERGRHWERKHGAVGHDDGLRRGGNLLPADSAAAVVVRFEDLVLAGRRVEAAEVVE